MSTRYRILSNHRDSKHPSISYFAGWIDTKKEGLKKLKEESYNSPHSWHELHEIYMGEYISIVKRINPIID